jgi:excisionase family DNA binding protein
MQYTSHAVTYLSALRPHQFFALVRKYRPWLTPAQAAAYLGYSTRALESWRAKGKGPAFRGRGKNVRYNIEDLDQYIMTRGTSEKAA